MVGLTLYGWGDEMMCAGLWLDADSAVSVIVHVTVLCSRMGTEFVKPSHLLYIWGQIDFLWSQCLGFGASYRYGSWLDVLSWEWVLEMNYEGRGAGAGGGSSYLWFTRTTITWRCASALSFLRRSVLNHKCLSQMSARKNRDANANAKRWLYFTAK